MQKIDVQTLEQIGFPVFVLEPNEDNQPVYQACNQRWFASAGYTKSEVYGRTAQQIFQGRLGREVYKRHAAAMRTHRPVTYDVSLPLRGVISTAHTRLIPVEDEAGELLQIIGSSVDRSSDNRADEANLIVASMTAEMEDFISLAAHDLRSPMRNIQGLAQMLRDGFVDQGDGKLEILNMLEEVALKATHLITDILAHAQAIHATQGVETFSIEQICSDILITIDPFRKHPFHSSRLWINGDKLAYQIVLRNLIDNAIKHAGKEQVILALGVSCDGGGQLSLALEDNGNGFANPAIAFLDGGQLRIESGFGLLGVRRLVNARGGMITAANKPDGPGSIVTFTLPGVIVDPPRL